MCSERLRSAILEASPEAYSSGGSNLLEVHRLFINVSSWPLPRAAETTPHPETKHVACHRNG